MNFIFFGRLVKEKGFDYITEALRQLSESPEGIPGNFYIFGEGELLSSFLHIFEKSDFFINASSLSPEEIYEMVDQSNAQESGPRIYFFGWQSQSVIRSILGSSHFILMPSRFLETFGLSALESLSEGVPVIGFKKGGLVPFVLDEGALAFSDDISNVRTLKDTILQSALYDGEMWKTLSDESRRIAGKYTQDAWMDSVRPFLPKKEGAKILLVSDYITLLGGIETHVQTIAKVLSSYGYEVEIFGWKIQKSSWAKILRLLGLVLSCYNIFFAQKLQKKLTDFSPDAIWFHSVSRFLGPLVVQKGVSYIHRKSQDGATTMITYHDLGLWSAFPSMVDHEKMIPLSPSISSFFKTLHSKNPIAYAATFFKYIQAFFLRNKIREVHTHFIPSSFMIPYVQHVSLVSKEKIQVLEHFL